jgi:hypothetical protein
LGGEGVVEAKKSGHSPWGKCWSNWADALIKRSRKQSREIPLDAKEVDLKG